MTQESGGSMKAGAGKSARAGAGRNRRRIGIGTALVAALGVGILGFGAGGATAATVATLTVDTTRDIVPVSTSASEYATTTGGSTQIHALNACLNDITDPSARSTFTQAHTVLKEGGEGGTVEKTINDPKPDPQGEQGDTMPSPVKSDNSGPCSLRMALTATAALSLPVSEISGAQPNTTVDEVRINVAPAVHGKTFELEVNPSSDTSSSNSGGSYLTSVPLPPIVGGNVVLDGCGGSGSSAVGGPCVNLELPRLLNLGGGFVQDLTRSVANGSPGLIALADHTTITGFAFQGGSGPAIQAPAIPMQQQFAAGALTVQNSWFGLKVDADGRRARTTSSFEKVAPPVGIQVSGSATPQRHPRLKDRHLIKGNVFADESDRMTGVLIAGGSHTHIEGNRFGTDDAGRVDSKLGIGTGVRLTGLDAADARQLVQAVNAAAGQEILNPDDLAIEVLDVATQNTIGGRMTSGSAVSSCSGVCNVFVNAAQVAIDVGGEPTSTTVNTNLDRAATTGVTDTTIQSNRIGIDVAMQKGANANGGIIVQNGSTDGVFDRDRIGTLVGGASQAEFGNVISGNKDAGLIVAGATDAVLQNGAGDGTVFVRNVGAGNNPNGIIKLGDSQVSGGASPPVVTAASTTAASGTAAPGSTVHVYGVAVDGKQGDISTFLAETTASGSGAWSAALSASPGSFVTATTTIAEGTSGLATNLTVPEPPKPPENTGGEKKEPPKPPDVEAPKPLLVGGQDASGDKPVVLTPKQVKTLSGQVEDDTGVEKVRVALQVLKVRKARLFGGRRGHARRGGRICRYVHLRKGNFVRRPCSRPPYQRTRLREAQSGATAWRLPLGNRVLQRLRVGRYKLLLETTDTEGNVTTHKVPVVIKKKAKRGRRARR